MIVRQRFVYETCKKLEKRRFGRKISDRYGALGAVRFQSGALKRSISQLVPGSAWNPTPNAIYIEILSAATR
jgi:hypothetical protein